MMEFFLFGGVRVSHVNLPAAKMTESVQRLLAYLLLHRDRLHSRSSLSGVFWGDRSEKSARDCLKTAVWRLRQALDHPGVPKGPYLVTTGAGDIGFNKKSNYWLDVAVFEKQVKRVTAKKVQTMDADDAAQLENALNLRSAEFMEGFYDDWVLRERERLNALHFKGMGHLMRYCWHSGAFDEAAVWGRQVLSFDSLREDTHRELMRLYWESGRRGLALRQYKACCRIMDEEMGAPSSPQTQKLYSEILEGHASNRYGASPPNSSPIYSADGTGYLDIACDDPHARLHKLEQLAGQIQRSIQVLKESIEKSEADRGVKLRVVKSDGT